MRISEVGDRRNRIAVILMQTECNTTILCPPCCFHSPAGEKLINCIVLMVKSTWKHTYYYYYNCIDG